MRIERALSITVFALATLIVTGTVGVTVAVFGFSRGAKQQRVRPPEGQQAVSPTGDTVLLSKPSGMSSFLYRRDKTSGTEARLTKAQSGLESEARFSHDGKLVVYSFSDGPNSKSAVWIVGINGSNPHAITGEDQDALHPVFSPDDSTVLFAASSFTGHYSPIVRPARHDWDIFSVPVQSTSTTAKPTQLTHESFYDMQSLDAIADPVNPGETAILISTTGYPIGPLIEQFSLGTQSRRMIFQPHVPEEPSTGPAFGEARFAQDGMSVFFLAATEHAGESFNYNLYLMSDVTGGQIKQLTHLKGVTTDLKILPGNQATFENSGTVYLLDINTEAVRPL